MPKGFSRTVLAAVAALVLGGVSGAQAAPGNTAFPDVFRGFKDQNGRAFDPASVSGRFVLVNFIFTGCGSTCPMQTASLAKFERSLPPAVRRRVSLISISVDPANDTPAALRRYAKAFSADERRWQFLSGSLPDTIRVTRSFAALRPDQVGTSLHTSEVRLFDPRRRMIQRYAGAPLASAQLRADLLALAATPS